MLTYIFLEPRGTTKGHRAFSMRVISKRRRPIPRTNMRVSPFSTINRAKVCRRLIQGPLPTNPNRGLPQKTEDPPCLPTFHRIHPMSTKVRMDPNLHHLQKAGRRPIRGPDYLLINRRRHHTYLAPLFFHHIVGLFRGKSSNFFHRPSRNVHGSRILRLRRGDSNEPSFPTTGTFGVLPALIRGGKEHLFVIRQTTYLPPKANPFRKGVNPRRVCGIDNLRGTPSAIFVGPSRGTRPICRGKCKYAEERGQGTVQKGGTSANERGATRRQQLPTPRRRVSPLDTKTRRTDLST